MGISLNVDTYLLCSMFNVSTSKLATVYSGKSVEEIMEAEAAQGNTAAANFDKSILSDPVKLVEFFKLNNVGNTYAILSNMSEKDLKELLPLLDKSDLVAGLNFFNKDKLMDLISQLPPEQLTKLVFEMFSPEQIMQMMPMDQLDKFLQSDKLDKGMELKYLQSMKPEVLAQMLEAVTGQPVAGSQNAGIDGSTNLDAAALFKQIAALPDAKFQEALLNIPPQNKRNFVLSMSKEDPKLFELFDPKAFTNIINAQKEKQDVIKASSVIEPEQLLKMLNQLPQDLTAVVMTQIDPNKFADVLIANFKDILGQICAA